MCRHCAANFLYAACNLTATLRAKAFRGQIFCKKYAYTFIQCIEHVYHKDGMTYIKGREPISEMREQSLPIDKYAHELRGMVLAMDTGLGVLV